MKVTFILLILLISFFNVKSQELNLGGYAGSALIKGTKYNKPRYLIGGTVEYQPYQSIISFNTDPYLILGNGEFIFTTPFYFKFVFGDQFRISPSAGAFFRTNSHYGWLAGLNIEYSIRDKLLIFLKADFYKDYWEDLTPRLNKYINNDESLWLGIGLKKNILY